MTRGRAAPMLHRLAALAVIGATSVRVLGGSRIVLVAVITHGLPALRRRAGSRLRPLANHAPRRSDQWTGDNAETARPPLPVQFAIPPHLQRSQ